MHIPHQCTICGGSGTLLYAARANSSRQSGGYHIAESGGGNPEIWQCSGCTHAWVPQVTNAIVDWYVDAPRDETYLAEGFGRMETAGRLLDRIDKTIARPRLLDIGSGPGFLVAAAMRKGFDAHGIDAAAWACEAAKQICNGNVTQRLISELNPAQETPYDCITSLDVIEHVDNPVDMLTRCRDLLRPAGSLVVVTPAFDSLLARLLGRHWYCVMPAHVQYFTRASLRQALERCGFEVTSVRWHVRRFSLSYLFRRLGLPAPDLKLTMPVCLWDAMEVHARKK